MLGLSVVIRLFVINLKQNMMTKKILFWLWAVLVVFCVIGEVTLLQFLPLAIITVMLGFDIWANKNLKVSMIVLSIIMCIVNLAVVDPSMIDVVMWGGTAIALGFTKK